MWLHAMVGSIGLGVGKSCLLGWMHIGMALGGREAWRLYAGAV